MASATAVEQKVRQALRSYVAATGPQVQKLIPTGVGRGKLYEAFVLSEVARMLQANEQLDASLVNGNRLGLRRSPGPIDASRYARVELRSQTTRQTVAALWTDIEVHGLTHAGATTAGAPDPSGYHELDLVIVDPACTGRPLHTQLWLGVECKNTTFKKRFLREVLGVRRELSLLKPPRASHFKIWPGKDVPADPPLLARLLLVRFSCGQLHRSRRHIRREVRECQPAVSQEGDSGLNCGATRAVAELGNIASTPGGPRKDASSGCHPDA